MLLSNLNHYQRLCVQQLCHALGASVCVQLYSRDTISPFREIEEVSRFAIVLSGRVQVFIFRWDYTKVLHSVPEDLGDLSAPWWIRGDELHHDLLQYSDMVRRWESSLSFRGLPLSTATSLQVHTLMSRPLTLRNHDTL
jgi:hypothetical protein